MQNIKQLRDSLSENYTKMIKNEMELATGRILAHTASKILSSCKVELEYNKLKGVKKVIDFLEY